VPGQCAAILTGERNPEKLAKLRDWRVKASEEEVARSLEGNWREDMLFELRQSVDAYDFIQKQVAECDQRLQTLMAELPMREAPAAVPTVGNGVKPPVRKIAAISRQELLWSGPLPSRSLKPGVPACDETSPANARPLPANLISIRQQ
jgi:hypothetical protein